MAFLRYQSLYRYRLRAWQIHFRVSMKVFIVAHFHGKAGVNRYPAVGPSPANDQKGHTFSFSCCLGAYRTAKQKQEQG